MLALATRQGEVHAATWPSPVLHPGYVLILTQYSAISPGTELSIIKRSPAELTPIGYSASGIVEEVGAGVDPAWIGRRVACYGAPYVHHAERLAVPTNLIAPVPDHVSMEEAAFAGLGAIAIHALRVAELSFGESVVVVGLGILGHLIARIADAAAYRVIGLDLQPERASLLARHSNAQVCTANAQVDERLSAFTGGAGADAVLLCASGPGPLFIDQALLWGRKQSKVVIVGDVSMEFSRELMFQKEAQIRISRAGGPGRYDAAYERQNHDYPLGYVRWTEGRNIGAYLQLLADKRITVEPLITDRYPPARAAEAYANHRSNNGAFATLITYNSEVNT